MSESRRLITSLSNPKVKLWSSLLDKKGRDKSGLYLVEGPHLVAEALASGAPVECVVRQHDRPLADDLLPFVPNAADFRADVATAGTVPGAPDDPVRASGSSERASGSLAKASGSSASESGSSAGASGSPANASGTPAGAPGVPWYEATTEVMAKCSDTVHHQGVFAVIRKYHRSLQEVLDEPDALVLAADRVQDPGNAGTMIRSADAAGATAVILGKGCVDLYNPKTIRSTMGSLFHLPVLEWDLKDALRQAAERGIRIVSATLDAEQSFYDIDFTRSTWILMGSEAHGVSPDLLSLVNQRVKIPMKGRAESLNVAMASTIVLYEAFRQRHFYGKPDR